MRTRRERIFTGEITNAVTLRETVHASIAREAAEEAVVLLENDNFLPIRPRGRYKKLALYGQGASRTIKGGTGSGDVNERYSVSIYEGLKNAGFVIASEDWIQEYDRDYEIARASWRDYILEKTGQGGTEEFFNVYSQTPFIPPQGGIIEPTDAEAAIYVISRVAGEGADRKNEEGDYLLYQYEKEQIATICELYDEVVIIINTGGVMDLSYVKGFSQIKSLLVISQLGMEGGNAVASCICGSVNPSGKLTDTWAKNYGDYPNAQTFSYLSGSVEREEYREGIYVGYRYFDTFDIVPAYSFGYGLSYTDFSIEPVGISVNENLGIVTVELAVKNTGSRFDGKEVVQLYASCPQGELTKEYRRLIGYAKTKLLAPGEVELLILRIPVSALASFDDAVSGFVLESGEYILYAGNSLCGAKAIGRLSNMGSRNCIEKTDFVCKQQEKLEELSVTDEVAERIERKRAEAQTTYFVDCDFSRIKCITHSYDTEEWKKTQNLEESIQLVNQMTTDQLLRMASGDPNKSHNSNLGSAGIAVPGSAGETNNCAENLGVASIALADGPAGLRLAQNYDVENGMAHTKPFQENMEKGIFGPKDQPVRGVRYYQNCTAIPVGTALAQTWNDALVERVGAMIGLEMDLFRITLWLAPGMNIHRNPLCGRNFEYYSEDPLLSGKMAAALTRGVQSVPGCGTTIKHFACNNQENNRTHSNSIVSQRALRELYLRGFEIAVKESKPLSIMTSYNYINGIHAANNYDLCMKVARMEWGFDGMIMTDWTTTHEDPDCTAAGCMRAGNDLIMPGEVADYENLKKELEDGSLPIDDLKDCIVRIVNVVLQSNQYEI